MTHKGSSVRSQEPATSPDKWTPYLHRQDRDEEIYIMRSSIICTLQRILEGKKLNELNRYGMQLLTLPSIFSYRTLPTELSCHKFKLAPSISLVPVRILSHLAADVRTVTIKNSKVNRGRKSD